MAIVRDFCIKGDGKKKRTRDSEPPATKGKENTRHHYRAEPTDEFTVSESKKPTRAQLVADQTNHPDEPSDTNANTNNNDDGSRRPRKRQRIITVKGDDNVKNSRA